MTNQENTISKKKVKRHRFNAESMENPRDSGNWTPTGNCFECYQPENHENHQFEPTKRKGHD